MNIKKLRENWNKFGKTDPLWAIVNWPDKKGNRWRLNEFFQTGIREIDEVMTYVDSLTIDVPRQKAMDFGCGVGRLTQRLADYFDEVYGIDIAPSMIELAKKYNSHGSRCKYVLNDTDNLMAFRDCSFDFIYSHITLQHMKPRYAANYIREFLRILVPGGLLIFQQPSEQKFKPRDIRSAESLKEFVKALTPEILLTFYQRAYAGISRRRMEMYGMRREDVIKLLEENGSSVIDITEDRNAGPDWKSYRYCVSRK